MTVTDVARTGGIGRCPRARLARAGGVESAFTGRRADVVELTGVVVATAHTGRDGPASSVVLDATGLAGVARVERAVGITSLLDRTALADGHAPIESHIAQPGLASRRACQALSRLRIAGFFTVASDAIRTRLFGACAAPRFTMIIGRARVAVVTHTLRPRDELTARRITSETRLTERRAAIPDAGRAIDAAYAFRDAFVPTAESIASAATARYLLATAVFDSAALEGWYALGGARHTAVALPGFACFTCVGRRGRRAACAGRACGARTRLPTAGVRFGGGARARLRAHHQNQRSHPPTPTRYARSHCTVRVTRSQTGAKAFRAA